MVFFFTQQPFQTVQLGSVFWAIRNMYMSIIYLHILVRWKSKGKKRVSAFVLFGAFSTAVPAKTLTVHLSIGSDTHINSATTASKSVY